MRSRFICVATATVLLSPSLALASALWNRDAVRADAAPGPVQGARIIVAVLDSGVYAGAAALDGVEVLPGRDFVEGDEDPTDDNGHGTHIASLIAGRPGGQAAPLCPECVILPVKVLDSRGLGDARALAYGLRFAANNGAQVINMSMGFDPGYDPGEELAEAVAYARRSGIVMVASVGNEGRIGATYPAAYPGVIAVAAVDYDGRRTAYSNISPAVAVAAPGGDDRDRDGDGIPESILSDGLAKHGRGGAEPWLYSGTSQAAAHVSALAGRLLAHGVPPSRVLPLLVETARDVEPRGFDVGTGAGIVDFAEAISRAGYAATAASGSGSAASPALGSDLPRPWSDLFACRVHEGRDGRFEVKLTDTHGDPAPGAVLFAHWRGTTRVEVARADGDGRIALDAGDLPVSDLVVDRIAEGASAAPARTFLGARNRPYQGILASPLARFPR